MYNSKDIRAFISNWNLMCPVDRWWREKHNISFNSPTHRATSFIDMYAEFWEWRLFHQKTDKKKTQETPYIKGTGNFLKHRELTEKEIDEIYDSIDIDAIE